MTAEPIYDAETAEATEDYEQQVRAHYALDVERTTDRPPPDGDRPLEARDAQRLAAAEADADLRRARLNGQRRQRGDTSMVNVSGRQHADLVDEIIGVLDAANEPATLFTRAGKPTRVRTDEHDSPLIEPLDLDQLQLHAARAALFRRRVKTRDGFEWSDCPPPTVACRGVLANGCWPFPPLLGLTELPPLRPNGTFASAHGYDPATSLYYWARGRQIAVPDDPSPTQLADAVAVVEDLLGDFPFDTTADRANAWGLLLTPVARPIITGPVPLAAIDAPEPGTGKGLLVEVSSRITTGRAAALQPMPSHDEELEKKITTLLLAGASYVAFDNIEGTIRSSVLAVALTAETWQGRLLGRSEKVQVPARVTWMVTGNNLDVGGDLARRCYRIRLDAHRAQPWKRTGFRHPDLLGHVQRHRAEIVAALCTIVRAWWMAGRPEIAAVPAMGNYTSWVRTVGGVLGVAGIDGFLDNLDEFHATADLEAAGWLTFLAAWRDHYGTTRTLPVAELVQHMEAPDSTLRHALPDDLAGRWGTPGFSRSFGRALVKKAGRHFGDEGLHIVAIPPDRTHAYRYSVAARDNSRANPQVDGQTASYASGAPFTA